VDGLGGPEWRVTRNRPIRKQPESRRPTPTNRAKGKVVCRTWWHQDGRDTVRSSIKKKRLNPNNDEDEEDEEEEEEEEEEERGDATKRDDLFSVCLCVNGA